MDAKTLAAVVAAAALGAGIGSAGVAVGMKPSPAPSGVASAPAPALDPLPTRFFVHVAGTVKSSGFRAVQEVPVDRVLPCDLTKTAERACELRVSQDLRIAVRRYAYDEGAASLVVREGMGQEEIDALSWHGLQQGVTYGSIRVQAMLERPAPAAPPVTAPAPAPAPAAAPASPVVPKIAPGAQ